MLVDFSDQKSLSPSNSKLLNQFSERHLPNKKLYHGIQPGNEVHLLSQKLEVKRTTGRTDQTT